MDFEEILGCPMLRALSLWVSAHHEADEMAVQRANRIAYRCADLAIREWAPRAFESKGLAEEASILKLVAPVLDVGSACAAAKVARRVYIQTRVGIAREAYEVIDNAMKARYGSVGLYASRLAHEVAVECRTGDEEAAFQRGLLLDLMKRVAEVK